MKKSARLLSLLLVLMLAVALFSGCGGQGSESAQKSAGSASSAAPAAEPTQAPAAEPDAEPEPEDSGEVAYPLTEETVTFDMFTTFPTEYSDSSPNGWGDNEAYKAMEELTNVHIEFYQVASGNNAEQYNLLIAGGEYTDFIGGSVVEYDDGVTIALNELIDQFMPNYKELLASNELYAKGATTDDGLRVGIYGFYTEGYPVPYGPVIRQDWLDDLGMAAPVTYDDYYNVLNAFKTEKGASSALYLAFNGVPAGNYLLAGYGVAGFSNANTTEVPFYQVDGEVGYGPIQQGYYDYLVMMNKWYNDGLISPDFATTGSYFMPENDMVANGECGIFYTLIFRLSAWETLFDADSGVNIQPIADAVQKEGDVNHLRHINSLIGNSIGISSQCEDPELAARWLDTWYTDFGYMLANYGEEDLTYTKAADGSISFTDTMLKNPDGLNFDQCLYRYCLYNGGIYFNDWTRSTLAYTPAQTAAIEIWNQSDFTYGFSSAITMTAEESADFDQAYADIKTFVAEQTLYFIMGDTELNEENWNKYVAQVEDMGIADCTDIKQASVDRYNARGMDLTA